MTLPYLSKIRINPRRPAALRLLRSPASLHGAVMAGFPDTVEERVLWRIDADDPLRPHLLVLTERTRPDWTHLVAQAGWPAADGDHFLIRDYAPLLERLTAGEEFAFRLTANPVQNTKRPDKPTAAQESRRTTAERDGARMRGFRIGHRTASAQLGWLLDRVQRAQLGFTIPTAGTGLEPAPGLALPDNAGSVGTNPDVALSHRETLRFTKKRNGPEITLSTATFEGRLRVTDPDILRRTLLAGIGPKKAYGCGLLTLAPLPVREEAQR